MQFSLNGRYEDLENLDCFGINKELIKAPINKVGSRENIGSLDNLLYKKLNLNIVEKAKNVYKNGLNEFLDEVHIRLGGNGSTMPKELKEKILNEITSDEKKIGRKYTQKEVALSTYKMLKKFMKN